MSIEAMKQLIEDMISMMEYHVEQTRPIHTTTVALQAAKDALKKIEQSQQVDKEGSPCPEFWDWLPKAYNFDGDGAFTKYNMEVAFFAGKQAIEQAQQAEPVAWPKTPSDISNMIGSSFVWREHKISDVEPHQEDKYCVTAHDLLEAFEHWSGYTSPPPRQPLTNEEIDRIWMPHTIIKASDRQRHAFARAIEAKLKEKNNA